MTYSVLAKINGSRRIYAVDSAGFISDMSGWVKIDEGSGDRFYLAQGNYFPKPIMDDRGVCRYALDENDHPYELTQEQMDADYVEPETQPTPEERIAQLEEELKAAKILLGLEV
jgi:hypothetical protein